MRDISRHAPILQVREEMDAMKAQYEAHTAVLQEKLQWYADNQRLLTDNDELLAQQAHTIAELRKRLEALSGGKAAERRTAELTKQVRAPHGGALRTHMHR
jgi:uncharacterized phage infection (PIP) family protein YhgE